MNILGDIFELKKNKINLKYENIQEIYFPLLQFKSILFKKDKVSKNRYYYSDILDKKHNNYIIQRIKLDNDVKEDNIQYELSNSSELSNKCNTLIIINNKDKVRRLFNKNFYNEYSKNKVFQYDKSNIFKEYINLLNNRKITSKLTIPHYFFTSGYNEKSMISQIKYWTNSIYNFNKDEKKGNYYLDLYTSKLIKLFFTIKYIKRKRIWNTKLFKGFKIISDISVFKLINRVMRYTSIRTVLYLKNLNSFSFFIRKHKLLEEQINKSNYFNKIIDFRKNELFSGYYPKKKDYFRRLTRILVSKPIFKHTSYNIIIDLFIFNNKTYKIRMLKNIINRRSLYKYMYSMYIDYSFKIKETISRPRFFYINLIEPKVYNYYYWIIRWYEVLIFKYQDSYLKKKFFLISQLNFIHKNKYQFIANKLSSLQTIFFKKTKNYIKKEFKDLLDYYIRNLEIKDNFLKNFNNENNNFNLSFFKNYLFKSNWNNYINSNIKLYIRNYYIKEINHNNINKYYKIRKNNKSYNIDFYNTKKNLIKLKNKKFTVSEEEKSFLKNSKEKKSKYFLYKNYLADLEKKSNTPFDLNTLTMWSRKGLGEKKSLERKARIKNFRHDKYSYNEFKRRNFYKNGKRISPKKWKKKLMSFFLFSKKQKKDTNSDKIIINKHNHQNFMLNNQKFVNDYNSTSNKKQIIKYFSNIKNNKKNTTVIYNKNERKEIEIKKLIKKEPLILKEILTKEENYIQEINFSNDNNKNLLNTLFSIFYNYKDNKLNNNNEEGKRLIKKLEKSSINYKIRKKLFNIINNNFVSIVTKPFNSKVYRNNRDNFFKNIFSKSMNINNYTNNNKHRFKLYKLSNKINSSINSIVYNGDLWSMLYYLNYIKKEFLKIKKNVLETNSLDIIYSKDNININSYNNNKDLDIIYKNNVNYTKSIKCWRSYYSNKRENYLSNKLNFNEKLFKPYYRYMIPLLIIRSYYHNLVSLLSYKSSIFNINKSLIKNRNNIISDNTFIFNFVTVKTLLGLLRYNYRSLIRIKPKYYYLNKLRLYSIKLSRLNNNSWINSLKYFISLRKTPKKFWMRYHKVASYYFTRIQENSELDTKRKILLPFVLYFEDILFNIYGKWALIRLWPLKKYFLSSYILANRILLLMLWRGKYQKYKYDFQDITAKLISAFRALQIKKVYHHYYVHNYRWPSYLINKVNNYNNDKSNYPLSYNNLELFFNKIDRNDTLNTYPLLKNNLTNYLPSINNKYINVFNNYLNNIKTKKEKNKIFENIKNNDISKLQYSYFLLKPLKNYLLSIRRYLDISGIKFLISGRTGIKRNNLRSVHKTKLYGNLIGPRYISHKLINNQTMYIPHIKGYIKSNIDYTKAISKSKNGSISLKIWVSSIISSDVNELVLHLLHIKSLYLQIINRYYIVDVNFINIKNYYSFNSVKNVTKNLNIKMMKGREKSKWKKNANNWKSI